MIDKSKAATQILRLSGLHFFPRNEKAREELINALASVSRDVAHAGGIVSKWLESSPNAPTPADLWQLGRTTDREENPRYWTCSNCNGTGWAPEWQLITWTDGTHKSVQRITREQFAELKQLVSGTVGDQIVREAYDYCTACARGRNRRAAVEAERSEAA